MSTDTLHQKNAAKEIPATMLGPYTHTHCINGRVSALSIDSLICSVTKIATQIIKANTIKYNGAQ